MVLEPTPVLQLVRLERLARQPAPPPVEAPAPRTADPDDDASQDDDADEDAPPTAGPSDDESRADDPHAAAEDDVRTVVVRRRRLATTEDLIRATLRRVEMQRPRQLHGDRMLLRAAGAVCHCDGDATELARVQTAMRAVVREARDGLKRCIGTAVAADPRVIVKAPLTLVMTQAMLTGPVIHRFTPEFEIGPQGLALRDAGWPEAPAELTTCIEGALQGVHGVDTSTIRAQHRVRVPLVGFSQHAFAPEASRGIHWMLSMQAAAMGWLHYERGVFEQALAYFEDAYWVFHEGEYLYLIGLAHERLGAHQRAAAAYERYVRERPYATEVEELRVKIRALRTAGIVAVAERGAE